MLGATNEIYMTFPLWLEDLAKADNQWLYLRGSHQQMLNAQTLNRLFGIAGWQLGD